MIQDRYTPNYHGLDYASGNRLQLRMAIPYQLAGTNNIFRITLSYVTDSPANSSGFSDITLFNLTTFNRSWGLFGVGAVALLPSGSKAPSVGRLVRPQGLSPGQNRAFGACSTRT